MILQIELTRVFLVFGVGMVMAIFFLGLGISTIIRRRSRLNVTFSGYFLSISLGLIINAAYAIINPIIQSEPLALWLNYLSGFLIFYGSIFMLATNFILLHSGASYEIKSEVKLLVSYAIVLGGKGVFYFFGGVQFNESTNWRPVWSLPYFIYVFVVTTAFTVIPTIYTSFKILKTMQDKKLRVRWIRLMIGLIGLFIFEYLAFFTNYLNDAILRNISSLYALLVFIWVWLIYKGVKKEA